MAVLIHRFGDESSNPSRLEGDSYNSILVIVFEFYYVFYMCVFQKDLQLMLITRLLEFAS